MINNGPRVQRLRNTSGTFYEGKDGVDTSHIGYYCNGRRSINSVCKYWLYVQCVLNVTFLSKRALCMGPTINLLILNVLTFLYKYNYNFGHGLNILTIFQHRKP